MNESNGRSRSSFHGLSQSGFPIGEPPYFRPQSKSATDFRRHISATIRTSTARLSGRVIGQSLQALLIRRAGNAALGNDRRDVAVRRHVESRVGDLDSVRGEADVFDVSDFAGVALFNWDQVARREVEVEGGDRGGDVKGDVVLF